jgi:hypothetical protein
MSKEMKVREKKEYDERHNDRPLEIRPLLRAHSSSEEPDMDSYKKELEKARKDLDPKVPAQLIALMGSIDRCPSTTEAELILNDLYEGSPILEDQGFKKGSAAHARAMEHLIDAFAAAKDQMALSDALLVFLRTASLKKIDLTIPEGGVRIRLEAFENGSKQGNETLESPNAPQSWRWDDRMPQIIPACQKWAREQMAAVASPAVEEGTSRKIYYLAGLAVVGLALAYFWRRLATRRRIAA